jgi:hypothetical protein
VSTGDEVDRQPGLDVLGEQQHGCLRSALSDPAATRAPSSAWSGGIRTSRIGDVRAVLEDCGERGGASPASATTSCPTSVSSDRRPARKSAESSPITTRTG